MNPQFWVIAPFEYDPENPAEWEQVWQYDLQNGIISIGWGELGDPSKLNEDQLRERIDEAYQDYPYTKHGAGQVIGMINAFYEVEVGDIVIARRGRMAIAAVGRVTRAAYYDPHRNPVARNRRGIPYPNHLDVEWAPLTRDLAFDTIVLGMQTIYSLTEERFREMVPNFEGFDTRRATDFEATERVETVISRIIRDTSLSNRVKRLHNHECQICGYVLTLPDGTRYAEGHHIHPLGAPHNGPDVMENILCLCPNHHAACDYGAIRLSVNELRCVEGHVIGEQFINYHNENLLCG